VTLAFSSLTWPIGLVFLARLKSERRVSTCPHECRGVLKGPNCWFGLLRNRCWSVSNQVRGNACFTINELSPWSSGTASHNVKAKNGCPVRKASNRAARSSPSSLPNSGLVDEEQSPGKKYLTCTFDSELFRFLRRVCPASCFAVPSPPVATAVLISISTPCLIRISKDCLSRNAALVSFLTCGRAFLQYEVPLFAFDRLLPILANK
jgi:hypothetical protein